MDIYIGVGYTVLLYVSYWIMCRLIGIISVGKFQEKYILITGCDSGFGLKATKTFASLGFNVFAGCFTKNAINDFQNQTLQFGRIIPLYLDVTDEHSIQNAGLCVRKTLTDRKGLWAVINNAGITGLLGPVQMQSMRNYENCLKVNLLGLIAVTQEFLPLVQMERGRIINTSSIMGRISFPSSSAYSVSKYGLEAFSDCLRREMASFGVSVHIIEPGFFKTTLTDAETLSGSYRILYDAAPVKIREQYGDSFVKQLKERTLLFLKFGRSSRTHLVVNAYGHAVTSVMPLRRYVVGWDALIVYRFLWNIPTAITDNLIKLALPRPA